MGGGKEEEGSVTKKKGSSRRRRRRRKRDKRCAVLLILILHVLSQAIHTFEYVYYRLYCIYLVLTVDNQLETIEPDKVVGVDTVVSWKYRCGWGEGGGWGTTMVAKKIV